MTDSEIVYGIFDATGCVVVGSGSARAGIDTS